MRGSQLTLYMLARNMDLCVTKSSRITWLTLMSQSFIEDILTKHELGSNKISTFSPKFDGGSSVTMRCLVITHNLDFE